jgi:prophage regulatory protein
MQENTLDPRRLLTRQQAAGFLGMSVFTLNQYASEGKGPAFTKIGRKTVYRLGDLETYRATQDTSATTPAPVQSAPALPAATTQTIYIMRLPEVLRSIGLSRSTLYAKIKTGDFPAPIKLGARSNGWNSAAVSAWIAARIASVGQEAN